MAPACGVGITSIARQSNEGEILNQVHQFHQQSNCAKPSQNPKICSRRDKWWQKEKKPELFFNSRRYLEKANTAKAEKQIGKVSEADVTKQPVSIVAQACAGGSTYTEVLMKQMGY